MKFGPCLLALCLLTSGFVHAEGLSEEDKQKLLDTLENILQGNESAEDKNVREALKVLAAAAMDENAASDLYEKSYKKINFEDKERKDKDWREWKDKNKDRLTSSAFKRILKYQCQWAVLTLQAAKNKSENPDFSQYSSQALSMLNTIAADYKDLKKFRGDMQGSILSGPVGRVLKVNGIQAARWPTSIFDVNAVFEQIIFPQYRNAANISGLRSAWNKRISLELAFSNTKEEEAATFLGIGDDKRKKTTGSKHTQGGTPAKNDIAEASMKAINSLRWNCEVDCYKIGDEATASSNMLSMIRAIKDTREQNNKIQELTAILSGENTDGETDSLAMTSGNSSSASVPSTPPAPRQIPKHDDSDFVYDGPLPPRNAPSSETSKNAGKPSAPKVVEITDEVSEAPAPAQQPKPPVEITGQETKQDDPGKSGATPPKKADDDFFGD